MSARALWNLHDAIMAGEQPTDCPDCGAKALHRRAGRKGQREDER